MKFRSGFTLIEVMVVMVVSGLLLGLGSLMLSTARVSANISKTRSVITVINSVLDQKLEELRNRPMPISIQQSTDPLVSKIELTPTESARVRLLMMRDTMRMELPDRYSDLVLNDSIRLDQVGAYTEPLDISARAMVTFIDGTTAMTPTSVDWWEAASLPNRNVPGLLSAYRARLPVESDGTTAWTPQFASSECLYLILSTTFMGGVSAIELLPRGHVKDTDGDNVPEIVDAWDVPIGFIRWPVGFAESGSAGIPTAVADIEPEESDLFRVDFAYADGAVNAAAADPKPRSLRPLVVSAGPDGVFDLRFSQTGSAGQDVVYSRQTWPVNAPWVGTDEVQFRRNPYPYIDPYLRQSAAAGLIGEPLDTDNDGSFAGAADNITNYNLMREAK